MKRIVILTTEPFPYGAACTNRVLTYVNELDRLNYRIHIYCLWPTRDKKNIELLDNKGKFYKNNVTIEYSIGGFKWPNKGTKAFRKLLLYIYGLVRCLFFLIYNRKDISIIQTIRPSPRISYIFGYTSRFLKIPFLTEINELPYFIKNKEEYYKNGGTQLQKERTEKSFRMYDGWILETEQLADYYSNHFKTGAKCEIVPITVEYDRFNIEKTDSIFGKYIAYCGNMLEEDGVSILIKAFNIIASKHSDINLVLAGNLANNPGLKDLVDNLGISGRVIFTGFINRDDIPSLMVNALVLALASPECIRSTVSMPIKIAEYLATGNPVVVTGLGEINRYLIDGVNAYLSKPDSEKDFAEKLDSALSNYEESKRIGSRGKRVAYDNFRSASAVIRIESLYNSFL